MRDNHLYFGQKVVMIPCSCRGVGLEIAARFLRNGDKVVISCRNDNHIEESLSYLSQFGHLQNILSFVVDIRNKIDVQNMVKETQLKFKRIDLLINSVSIQYENLLEETSEDVWDEIINVNLKGVFLMIHEILPFMKKQGKGMIINLVHLLDDVESPKLSAYTASQYGLLGLTQSVFSEVKQSDIKIYAVTPKGFSKKEDSLNIKDLADQLFDISSGDYDNGSLIPIEG